MLHHSQIVNDKARQTREQQAAAELAHTQVSRAVGWAICVLFGATLLATPIVQHVIEIRRNMAVNRAAAARGDAPRRVLPRAYDALDLLPRGTQIVGTRSIHEVMNLFPRVAALRQYEQTLERDSVVAQWLLPRAQQIAGGWLGVGNEKAYLGRNGWVFYRADLEHAWGSGFLQPETLSRRALGATDTPPPQLDPRKAILHFHQQLRDRGITLIVMPVPVKPTIQPEMFMPRYSVDLPVHNPSFASFKADLERAGVLVFDCTPVLMRTKRAGQSAYLAADTHWTPSAMEAVAAELAKFVRHSATLPEKPSPQHAANETTATHLGDTAAMLKLPANSSAAAVQTVRIHQVLTAAQSLWQPDETSDVLVLGDSFCNIYSLAPLGWGSSAGMVEHLSLQLKRNIDALLRNDNGSFASRQMLAGELARGRDRLAGKKIVVWQFAARELSIGDWKLIDLRLGTKTSGAFIKVPQGRPVEVCGVIKARGSVPRPHTAAYADHIVAVWLTDVEVPAGRQTGGTAHCDALVYLWSMRNHQWTAAAEWRVGQTVRVKLSNEADAPSGSQRINRGEDLPDPGVLLESACWGEIVE